MEYSFKDWFEQNEAILPTIAGWFSADKAHKMLEKTAYNSIMALLKNLEANQMNPTLAKLYNSDYRGKIYNLAHQMSSQSNESVGGWTGAALGGAAGTLAGGWGIPGAVAGAALGHYGGQAIDKARQYFQEDRPLQIHQKLEKKALTDLSALHQYATRNWNRYSDAVLNNTHRYWELLDQVAAMLDDAQQYWHDYKQYQHYQQYQQYKPRKQPRKPRMPRQPRFT